MNYSRHFGENESIATDKGARSIISYDEVLTFAGGTQDDIAELLMDVLNGVYSAEDCMKDIKEYGNN